MRSERPRATTVDEYIAGFPPQVRKRLTAIRRAVRKAAPDAVEAISYGIPAYKQHGIVVYFAAHSNHIGMYPAPRAEATFRKELASFGGGKGTVQFPHAEPIPLELVGRIVAFRSRSNVARAVAKGNRKRAR